MNKPPGESINSYNYTQNRQQYSSKRNDWLTSGKNILGKFGLGLTSLIKEKTSNNPSKHQPPYNSVNHDNSYAVQPNIMPITEPVNSNLMGMNQQNNQMFVAQPVYYQQPMQQPMQQPAYAYQNVNFAPGQQSQQIPLQQQQLLLQQQQQQQMQQMQQQQQYQDVINDYIFKLMILYIGPK